MVKLVAFVGNALEMMAVAETLWPATLTDVIVANVIWPIASTNQKTNDCVWVNKKMWTKKLKKKIVHVHNLPYEVGREESTRAWLLKITDTRFRICVHKGTLETFFWLKIEFCCNHPEQITFWAGQGCWGGSPGCKGKHSPLRVLSKLQSLVGHASWTWTLRLLSPKNQCGPSQDLSLRRGHHCKPWLLQTAGLW